MRAPAALFAAVVLETLACSTAPTPAAPSNAARHDVELEARAEIDAAGTAAFGAVCGFAGYELPLAQLAARWRAERRLDKLAVLLGHPHPVARAFGVAAWALEPASARSAAVDDALAYMREDTTTTVPVCEGCLQTRERLGTLVRLLMREDGTAYNPLAIARPQPRSPSR